GCHTGRRVSVEERFWSLVDKSANGGCWEWQGEVTKRGYGRFRVKGKRVQAHRFAYEITHGPIPAEQNVCHECDNPPCVRPAHLWPGTQKQNIQDAKSKGRLATGDRSGERRAPDRHRPGGRHSARRHPARRPPG